MREIKKTKCLPGRKVCVCQQKILLKLRNYLNIYKNLSCQLQAGVRNRYIFEYRENLRIENFLKLRIMTTKQEFWLNLQQFC